MPTISRGLRHKQSAFAKALGQLIGFVYAKGWELTLAEGYVGDTDGRDGDHDGPHMRGGTHYMRLGQDLNLWIAGTWITRGSHPAWAELGSYWKGLHPAARWGGDFEAAPGHAGKDANHFSFEHAGKS